MRAFDKKFWNNNDGYGIDSGGSGGDPNTLLVINNSSDTVEVYYEIDKEEGGNTFVYPGSSAVITTFETDAGGFYLRYESGGSENTHTYSGTYRGTNYTNVPLNYYDGNILHPLEDSSATQWDFLDGDSGTVTITGGPGPGPGPGPEPGNYVTYDGVNRIAYGDNADNLIEY